MGNILIRRRMLVPSATSAWDDEWVYTDGSPTVDGWTQSGSGSMTLVSGGYRSRGTEFNKSSVAVTSGVIEAYFQIENARSTMNGNRARLRIGDASNAVMVIFSNYSGTFGIYLNDYSSSYLDSSIRNGTKIGDFSLGDWYKVKITIDGTVGTVEINDAVVASNINTASMYNKGGLYFCGSSSTYFGSVWQYVKYKVNS